MNRENLTVLSVVAVIVVGAFLAAHFIQKDRMREADSVCDVSVRSLAADPEFYSGKRVRLSFDGLEDGKDSTLFFRKRMDSPPLVVFHFSVMPDHRDGKFVGFCAGRDGERVLVVDCKVVK